MPAALAQTPQTHRVKAADHHPPFRHQHPRHLPQHPMRVRTQLQCVGQQYQVQAVGRKRQGRKAGHQCRPSGHLGCRITVISTVRSGFGRQPAVRHAIAFQAIKLWQAQLQRVVTKHIGHRFGQPGTLPVQQVLAGRAGQPRVHPYNLSAHEVNSTTCFQRQLHLDAARRACCSGGRPR